MKKQSWVCTFVTQVSLCFAFYLVFQIGRPQKAVLRKRDERRPLDLYFISVVGGFRPIQEQTLLLKEMEKVIKEYNVQFIINISELGEEDPLLKNATSYNQSVKVPWYTSRTLKGQGTNYFHKEIELPFGRTLDVIAVDTKAFQDPFNADTEKQSQWLTKMLQESGSNWRIVVGYYPLIYCTTDSEQSVRSVIQPLYNILLNHGVNAYLSGHSCVSYLEKEGTAVLSSRDIEYKGPHLASVNQKEIRIRENVDGFLLHRISSLEFVSHQINLHGEVVRRIALQQRGRGVI